MLLQEIEKHARGVAIRPRYENFIGGKWVAPVKGQYFKNLSPIDGKPLCEVPRSTAEDIELALDAAHAAKDKWGQTSPGDRARVLNKIADRMEANLEQLAVAETWENGKPVREALTADLPLAVDCFRGFAGADLQRAALRGASVQPAAILAVQALEEAYFVAREDAAFLNTAWTLQILRGVILWLGACALAWPTLLHHGEVTPVSSAYPAAPPRASR